MLLLLTYWLSLSSQLSCKPSQERMGLLRQLFCLLIALLAGCGRLFWLEEVLLQLAQLLFVRGNFCSLRRGLLFLGSHELTHIYTNAFCPKESRVLAYMRHWSRLVLQPVSQPLRCPRFRVFSCSWTWIRTLPLCPTSPSSINFGFHL